MDRKIKIRQVHKDIKVLDKTVTVTDGQKPEVDIPLPMQQNFPI